MPNNAKNRPGRRSLVRTRAIHRIVVRNCDSNIGGVPLQLRNRYRFTDNANICDNLRCQRRQRMMRIEDTHDRID